MHRGKGFEGNAILGEFEHDRAAGAVAERAKPAAVDARRREQQIQRGATDGPHSIGVCQQRHHPGQHRLRISEVRPAGVVIHRQGDVAALGQ